MNANGKEMVPKGTVASWKTTRAARTLAAGAIRLARRRLLAILILGPIAGLGLMPAVQVTAQTFTTLHVFTDGGHPAGLIVAGAALFGTASQGGSSGNGTVFRVNTDGTGFTNLRSFKGTRTTYSGIYTNRDGAAASVLVITSNTV